MILCKTVLRRIKVCGVDDLQVLRKNAHHRRHNCSFTAGLDGHNSASSGDESSFHHLSASEVELCQHAIGGVIGQKKSGKHRKAKGSKTVTTDGVFSHKHKVKNRNVKSKTG